MDHLSLQSTLREMHAILQSRRLWLTFLAILAIFILTGPFGTSETMSFADRLLYWTIVQAGAWTFAISFSILANTILASSIENMLTRMMIGSLTAALPIGLLLSIMNQIFSGRGNGFRCLSEKQPVGPAALRHLLPAELPHGLPVTRNGNGCRCGPEWRCQR